MATFTVTSSPVTIDSGSTYELVVSNTGSLDVFVARGAQVSKLRIGGRLQVQPEGLAVTAYVSGAISGQVTTSVLAQDNPQGAQDGLFSSQQMSTLNGTFVQQNATTKVVTAPDGTVMASQTDAFAAALVAQLIGIGGRR